MANVTVNKNTYTVDPLYQWDLNQTLKIYGLSLASVPEIHFANNDMDRAIVRQSTMSTNGVISVDIPNSLLQKPYRITAYVCIYEGETFRSLYSIEIPVKARTKPADYTIQDNDEEIYSFTKLENMIGPAFERYEEINALYAEIVDTHGTIAENARLAQESAESAKASADATVVMSTAQVSTAEEVEALPSPSFGSYVNIGESLTEEEAVKLAGIFSMNVGDVLSMGSGYYKTQFVSVGGRSPAFMVRNIDVEGNVVYPWEWINPPMTLGVEYRTTERFNGLPVYKYCSKQVASDSNTTLSFNPPVDNAVIIGYKGYDTEWYPLNCEDVNKAELKRSDTYKTNYLEVLCSNPCTLTVELSYVKIEE